MPQPTGWLLQYPPPEETPLNTAQISGKNIFPISAALQMTFILPEPCRQLFRGDQILPETWYHGTLLAKPPEGACFSCQSMGSTLATSPVCAAEEGLALTLLRAISAGSPADHITELHSKINYESTCSAHGQAPGFQCSRAKSAVGPIPNFMTTEFCKQM